MVCISDPPNAHQRLRIRIVSTDSRKREIARSSQLRRSVPLL